MRNHSNPGLKPRRSAKGAFLSALAGLVSSIVFLALPPALAQESLVEFAKPELGFSLLVPSYFTSLERVEGSDSIFTFSGFNGRASIQVRSAALKKAITPEELGSVYQRKVLSEAIEITGGAWIDVSGVPSLRKVYTLSEQSAPGKPLEKVIVTVLYTVANDRFYVFQVSNLETIDWPEKNSVLESFDLFSSLNRSYPAAAGSGTVGTSGQTTGGLAPMTINSHPDGAKIFLNGAYAGSTPLTIRVDRVGTYEVGLFLDGFRPWSRSIQVNYDTVAMVDAFLDTADSEEVPLQEAPAPHDGKRVYTYAGSTPPGTPTAGSAGSADESANSADTSNYKDGRNRYSYDEAATAGAKASRSLETSLPNDLLRFETVYGELEAETRFFEEKIFHQRRHIRLDRKMAKKFKKLDQSVKSASRELVELYGDRSGAAELINRYSSLQTRVRQMTILSR